jgi:hypothetical protein
MQRPAPVTQQDAREPLSQEQEAQRERQRAHDRPPGRRSLASVLSSVTTRTPNSEMPTVLPLAARQQAKWTNPQAAYAMTAQMSPLFQGMSLPVSTLAANEMAAR